MNWEEELKELLQPAQTKDGWGYAVIEADADGFYKVIIPFISALLKEQRESIAEDDGLECHCGNSGYFVDANKYTGDAEQIQCEFCYTQKGSKFRILNTEEPRGTK